MSLKQFLLANPVDGIEETVILSERLKDHPFKIKPISNEEYQAYTKRATKINTKGKNKGAEFDSRQFNMDVVLNHTVEPNFRDADFVAEAGVMTPEQLVNKLLLSGEVQELSNKISALSGFDNTLEDDIEEVKND